MSQSETDFKTLPLRFWNSLTASFTDFHPLDEVAALSEKRPPRVRMYVCGPTVYDASHLGHARCYITWDLLFRLLRFAGYDVTYVRNVTDVDDKILNRSKESGETPPQLAERNYRDFRADMEALNVLPPTHEPRATAHIVDMQAGIKTLLGQGSAYVTKDGSVYFRVSSKADYGKLKFATTDSASLRKHLDDLKAGARVEVEEGKESPLDFALWKAIPAEDPNGWAFDVDMPTSIQQPGRGRPGWHLECSAMNHALFDGQPIDIHAGGADLIFPHHENEIAQSEAWMGKAPFSQLWLHNGFVNVSGEKMSKSLGNFSTIKALLERYDANTIRYFLLTNGYRMPVDFTDESLQSAQNWVKTRLKWLRQAWETIQQKQPDADVSAYVLKSGRDVNVLQASANPINPDVVSAFDSLLDGLSDDLNTAQALAALNKGMNGLKASIGEPVEMLLPVFRMVLSMWDLLGFDTASFTQATEDAVEALELSSVETLLASYHLSLELPSKGSIQAVLETLLTSRLAAKAAKDWPQADAIRKQFTDWGFQLLDSKDGSCAIQKNGVTIVQAGG